MTALRNPDESPREPRPACPWCGNQPCADTEPAFPHHSLCCLDGSPRACWGGGNTARENVARLEREADL